MIETNRTFADDFLNSFLNGSICLLKENYYKQHDFQPLNFAAATDFSMVGMLVLLKGGN